MSAGCDESQRKGAKESMWCSGGDALIFTEYDFFFGSLTWLIETLPFTSILCTSAAHVGSSLILKLLTVGASSYLPRFLATVTTIMFLAAVHEVQRPTHPYVLAPYILLSACSS